MSEVFPSYIKKSKILFCVRVGWVVDDKVKENEERGEGHNAANTVAHRGQSIALYFCKKVVSGTMMLTQC